MPEETILFGIFHFRIGNRGFTVGAPVNNSGSAVNKTFVIKLYKNLFNRIGAAIIKGKALSGPIARGAELFKLFANAVAVGVVPIPSAL